MYLQLFFNIYHKTPTISTFLFSFAKKVCLQECGALEEPAFDSWQTDTRYTKEIGMNKGFNRKKQLFIAYKTKVLRYQNFYFILRGNKQMSGANSLKQRAMSMETM